jgi:hypothetical protein
MLVGGLGYGLEVKGVVVNSELVMLRCSWKWKPFWPMFRSPQNSKFFHSLSITSIFSRLHGVLNVGKKNI